MQAEERLPTDIGGSPDHVGVCEAAKVVAGIADAVLTVQVVLLLFFGLSVRPETVDLDDEHARIEPEVRLRNELTVPIDDDPLAPWSR